MKTIWKFAIRDHVEHVYMPFGAEILKVRAQGSEILVWAIVETQNPDALRMFTVWNTGEGPMGKHSKANYIGTVQFQNGIVQHVFEEIASA